MSSFDLKQLPSDARATGAWAAALLYGLARDEAAGRRTQRLTEPNLDTWRRFRGRLSPNDLIALLFEDAAVLHTIPFDAAAIGLPARLDRLPEPTAEAWVRAAAALNLTATGADYVAEQARALGVPSRLSRSELHVVKPHQRVLELPGTGGQLAHHLVTSNPGLSLHDNMIIATGTWQEAALAGLIAIDLGAPHTDAIQPVSIEQMSDPKHPLRARHVDVVVGLHPSKGGLFREPDQLAIWFPNAKIQLV
jgi:hypothetical protein